MLPTLAHLLLTAGMLDVAVEIPEGTQLNLRLSTSIPGHVKPGLAVSTVLIGSVVREGQVVLPAGATVRGTVEAAGKLPRQQHRSYLRLDFDQIVTAAGTVTPIKARVSGVDNARETVDEDGRIIGLPWIPARPTKIEALLLLAAHAHPIALAAIEAGKFAAREIERVPIAYAAGTEVTVTLVEPVCVMASPQREKRDVSSSDALLKLASELPMRAQSAKSKRPSDLTNILLVGTRAEVMQAFLDAGWTQARPMGLKAEARGFLALATRNGYRRAAVSRLELDGARPEVVFEKQNNTLAKRHHVRIWSRQESFGGRPVWLAAASHDVGIAFDHKDRTFTHRIDGRIDAEREKLMADIEFTGQVRAMGLVDRPRAPRLTESATGESVETDGRLGVLVLEETRPKGAQQVGGNASNASAR